MIYDSDTNSDISENQINNHSQDEGPYDHKLALIWDGIQKTKNLQPSDYEDNEETYQMYKHKRISQDKALSYDKLHSSLQNKILNNLKAKNLPEPQTQQKKVHLQQKNPPSQNKPTHYLKKNLPYNQDLEQKLQKSKQNTNILMKKLIQAQEQIDYLENQLQKQLNEKQQLLIELKQKNYQMQIQAQAKTQEKQNKLMNSNRIDQSVIEAQITIDKYRLRLRAAQKQIEQKNAQFAQLEKQLKQLTSELHSNHLQFNQTPNQKPTYKGSELLELNQAYKTIQRMTALLKSTDEYRLLGNFAEDVKNIHFLSKIPQKIKSQISTVKLNPKTKEKKPTCQHCTEVKINQRLLWTPSLCYKKMLQMKMKHESLNEECIEQVLFEMNKLYLSKEETRVAKLKTYYETQIDKLKKKAQLTYDQILAKKQIQRLKKQLQTKKKPTKSMRAPSDPNVQEKLKKFNNNGSNLDNLRVIGQYEDQLRLKDKEVKLLMERIKLLQSQTSSYDKSLYMEGVLWIIDKILEELDTNGDDIREFEDKFRAKMSSASTAEEWIRLFKELFESVQELNNALIEKILSIKENTINKMSYAKLQ